MLRCPHDLRTTQKSIPSSVEASARRRTSLTIGTFSGKAIFTGEQLKMQAELRPSLRSPELRAGAFLHRYVIRYPEVSK
ncbi:Hypothetical protein TART1_0741 [Trichococcus shcherbakoviae]|uniref:Uncharacterized protein n=1 Tax=Trichococcus shcherbakoviae TaxID=2094020 RepID=A0A383TC93_9LACT|nr:Hypothetical protein TART1_0741 [Trichococcus shcherbakoviae]